jgi:predicted DNA-binding transcriptional regulator YafY
VASSSSTRSAPRWRTVARHGLLPGTCRYLVAHDVERADQVLRHYRVEGISEIEILDQSFKPDPGFDLAVHAKASFSSFVNENEVEWIVLALLSAGHGSCAALHISSGSEPRRK